MSIENRNKKVAISRWNKIHAFEKSKIKFDNKTKARICGFLAGDGSVMVRKDNNNKLHYVVRFFPDHESLATLFVKDFQSLYGKIPKVTQKRNHMEIICYSKPVVEDLLATCKFGIKNWRVPFAILDSRKAKIEWMRSFFDCESYVGEDYIKLQTVNKIGMNEVKKLLNELGFNPSTYVYQPKNKNWSRVYILILNKGESLKFSKLIGFNHKLKMKKLLANAGVA